MSSAAPKEIISIKDNTEWPGTSFLIVGGVQRMIIDDIAEKIRLELEIHNGNDGQITFELFDLLERMGYSPSSRFRIKQ